MKPTGIFERVRFLESRLDRMEAVILRQDADIRRIIREAPAIPEALPEAMEPIRRRMAEIAAEVAVDNGLTLAELRGDSREFAVSHPRQFAMLMMSDAGHATNAIGRFFKRDHSTVAHGIKAARERVRRMEEGRGE